MYATERTIYDRLKDFAKMKQEALAKTDASNSFQQILKMETNLENTQIQDFLKRYKTNEEIQAFFENKTAEEIEPMFEMKEIQELLQMFDNMADGSYLEVAHLLAKATDKTSLQGGDAIDDEALIINKLLTNYVKTKSFKAIHAHLKKSSNKEQTLRIMNVLAENHDLCTSAYSNTPSTDYTTCVNSIFTPYPEIINTPQSTNLKHQVSVTSYGGKK